MAKTRSKTTDKPMNRSLSAAKAAKQDEFYTQYIDIQKEVEAYLEFDPDTFRDKVVYCNCDDPFESNFFKYFAANFNKLGLKKLITTSYDGSPIAGKAVLFPEYELGGNNRQKPHSIAVAVEIDEVTDLNGDGATGIEDVKLFLERNPHSRTALSGGGDFRSPECVAFLKEADIVVTNPPFSLFREYVSQLMEHGKKFLIIGNKNAIPYKEIFPLVKDNRLWMGVTPMGTDMLFEVPPKVAKAMVDLGKHGSNYRIVGGKVMGRSTSVWFTNLDHGRRHQLLECMTTKENLRFSKHRDLRGKQAYDRYENYDAIEVPFTDAVPSDHEGMMGVPITFLDKYNPDQFEILGITKTWYGAACKTFPNQTQIGADGARSIVTKLNDQPALRVAKPPIGQTYYTIGNKCYIAIYQRILIRHRRPAKGKKK